MTNQIEGRTDETLVAITIKRNRMVSICSQYNCS